jgi:ketosteroid isomerase-like protein
MLDLYADDAVFDVSAVFTDVEPMHGRSAIRDYWGTFRQTWDNIRVDPLEAYDVGDGRLVIEIRVWAKGTRSGLGVDQRFAMIYAFRPDDEKILYAQLLPDVATAMAAAKSSSSRAVR